ncbi:MAG: glycosyltransferase [Pseudoalteromonas nigrifaciens]
MSIKVLHIVGSRPIGGIGTFLINLVKFDDSKIVKHDFLIHGDENKGDFEQNLSEFDSNISVAPPLSLRNVFAIIRSLKAFHTNNHYDIIHVHSPVVFLINHIICKYYNRDTIIGCHSHSTKYSDSRLKSVRNWLLHYPVKKLSQLNFACSIPSGKFLFGTKDFLVINNGIDTSKYQFSPSIRNELRQEMCLEDKFVLGHVGAFFPVKNHDFMLEVMSKLVAKRSCVVLMFIGGGELSEKFKIKAEQLKLNNNIYFLGRKSNINDYMMSFDMFLLPSLFEGVPLVGVEAQAAGLKCLLSDRITNEIKLIDSTEFLPIDNEADEWVSKIIKYMDCVKLEQSIIDRKIASDIVDRKGYGIKTNVRKVVSKYSEAV